MSTQSTTQQEQESPPSERLGGDQGKQSQVPSGLQNSPVGAAGKPFAANIETEWLRYLAYQQDRLKAAGDRYPYVSLYAHGSATAGSHHEPSDQMTRAATLEEAVTQRVAFLGNAEDRKAAKVAQLEKELAKLKGEGATAP